MQIETDARERRENGANAGQRNVFCTRTMRENTRTANGLDKERTTAKDRCPELVHGEVCDDTAAERRKWLIGQAAWMARL